MGFYGDISRIILLNAGYAVHDANWNYEKIRSPFARIYYVTEGSADLRLESGSCRLTPGHLYLLPPFTLHTDECDGHFELFYVHLYETENNPNSLFEQYQFPFELKALPIDRMLIERLLAVNPDRELQKYDPRVYDDAPTLLNTIASSVKAPYAGTMETQGILLQLLSRFQQSATSRYGSMDKRIRKSLNFIASNIGKDIQVNQLADICCLSQDHFIRLFKKEMKQTPLAYINEKRMEKALTLLVFTDLQVKDVAYQLSFENISYFNRMFRKHTGCTPVEYRKSI